MKKHILSGIDRIDTVAHLLKGRRVGLMTNPTGVSHDLQSSIDIIHERFSLSAMYAVEHGIRGDIQAGDHVENFIDPETGVNTFRDDPQGPHGYLVKQHEDEYYAWQINIRLASSSARIRRRRVRRKAKKTSKNGLYLRRFCDIMKM